MPDGACSSSGSPTRSSAAGPSPRPDRPGVDRPAGRRRSRVAALALIVAGAAVALAGCGGTGISRARLQSSVSHTFANLWVLQQNTEGNVPPAAGALRTRSNCARSTPGVADVGPGNDWVCRVVWLVSGPSTPVTAVYELTVKSNGCYTADGDGPASVNGAQNVINGRGHPVLNPLWEFDGCFEPG